MAGTLNGDRQFTLMMRAGSGNPAGKNLRTFGNKPAELRYIFIINGIDLIDTEAANLLAAFAATAIVSFRSFVSIGHE